MVCHPDAKMYLPNLDGRGAVGGVLGVYQASGFGLDQTQTRGGCLSPGFPFRSVYSLHKTTEKPTRKVRPRVSLSDSPLFLWSGYLF